MSNNQKQQIKKENNDTHLQNQVTANCPVKIKHIAKKALFRMLYSMVIIIIFIMISHGDIFDNGRLHIDSAYWQLFQTLLYLARLRDIVNSDQFQLRICCLISFPICN